MRRKPMYADFTQKIQVRQVTNTPTTAGGMDTTYDVKATVWGKIRPLLMSRQIGIYVREVQVAVKPTHVVHVRVNRELEVTREGLKNSMYFYVEDTEGRGRSFRILSIVDKEDRGIELEVLTREMGIEYGTDELLL